MRVAGRENAGILCLTFSTLKRRRLGCNPLTLTSLLGWSDKKRPLVLEFGLQPSVDPGNVLLDMILLVRCTLCLFSRRLPASTKAKLEKALEIWLSCKLV